MMTLDIRERLGYLKSTRENDKQVRTAAMQSLQTQQELLEEISQSTESNNGEKFVALLTLMNAQMLNMRDVDISYRSMQTLSLTTAEMKSLEKQMELCENAEKELSLED